MTKEEAYKQYLKLLEDCVKEIEELKKKREEENNPVIGLDGDELYKELDNKHKRKFLDLLASIDE